MKKKYILEKNLLLQLKNCQITIISAEIYFYNVSPICWVNRLSLIVQFVRKAIKGKLLPIIICQSNDQTSKVEPVCTKTKKRERERDSRNSQGEHN